MKKSLVTPPDPFTMSPLLVLLPVRGHVGRLQSLTSSLFARYERVAALIRDLGDEQESREASRRLSAEAAMLKQVLDWLAVKPQADS